MNRIRDALFEEPQINNDLLSEVLKASAFYGFPVSMAIHGGYGAGKTRFLKSIEASAKAHSIPCTFFHTSQYNPDQLNLVNALIVKMGVQYLKVMKKEELRATIIGAIAGSLDSALKFIGKDFSILDTIGSITKAIVTEKEQLLGEWTSYVDPVEALKNDFAKMVIDMSTECTNTPAPHEPWNYTFPKPWIILFDDMDRLIPSVALELILALRILLSAIDTLQNKRVPVLFLFSLNMDCLRDAIKARYANITDDNDKQTEFVEQFIRKYFVFGPKLPTPTKNSIISVLGSNNSDCLTDPVFKLLTNSKISIRTILTVIDRVHYLYTPSFDMNIDESRFVISFLLELLRNNSEEEFFHVITMEQTRTNTSFSIDIFNGIKDRATNYLVAQIRETPQFKALKNNIDAWNDVFKIAANLFHESVI